MKEFIELITTLAFILIFVVPFFRKKKKEAEEQKQTSAQATVDHTGQSSSGTNLEDVLGTIFDLPKTEKKQSTKNHSKKRKPHTSKPVSETIAEVEKPTELEPVQPQSSLHPAKALLASTSGLRQAILMKEILGKPKGMQE